MKTMIGTLAVFMVVGCSSSVDKNCAAYYMTGLQDGSAIGAECMRIGAVAVLQGQSKDERVAAIEGCVEAKVYAILKKRGVTE